MENFTFRTPRQVQAALKVDLPEKMMHLTVLFDETELGGQKFK
jgi:hypothetical protein